MHVCVCVCLRACLCVCLCVRKVADNPSIREFVLARLDTLVRDHTYNKAAAYWPLAKDQATTGQKEPGNRVNLKAEQPVLTG